MTGKDKRRYPRVRAKNVSAHLNVADQSSPVTIQDISAGGLFIETPEALPVGMPVAVNLARPGWTRVLKVTGRVVWAMAERTAARKGARPGMRIKFDPLMSDIAQDVMALLLELGAGETPPPPQRGDLAVPAPVGIITQPVSLKELQRVNTGDRIPVPDETLMQARDIGKITTILNPAHKPGEKHPGLTVSISSEMDTAAPRRKTTEVLSQKLAPVPSAPRGRKAVSQVSVPAVPAPTPLVPSMQPKTQPAAPSAEDNRLMVQVQGLLMQLNELQSALEARDKELGTLKTRLKEKETLLEKSDRDRKAAELAIQRLSMQLSSRR